MAKWANDSVMDAALGVINGCDRLFICSAQPTTYAEASATYDLATKTLSSPFTIANGDSSGRKITIAAQNTITVDHSGTATHWALGVSGTTTLVFVGTITSQVLTAGNTVNFPSLRITEIADPS